MQRRASRAVILLADDEPVIRNLVQVILTSAGYHVLSASDGTEALKLSRAYEGVIDLLISEAKLPELTGPDLASTISKERPNVRVLLITGTLPDKVFQQLSPELLRKPFLPEELLDRVHSILGSRLS
jgi:two-component system, cell cycle sensor histidine kinase and response regulator CckA